MPTGLPRASATDSFAKGSLADVKDEVPVIMRDIAASCLVLVNSSAKQICAHELTVPNQHRFRALTIYVNASSDADYRITIIRIVLT